jgi:hypothetical protein
MRKYLAFVFLLQTSFAFSQFVKNVTATRADDKVVVTYDIVDAKPNQKFELYLFASHNNFSQPLAKVSGDVGKNIQPGLQKKIVWDVSEELRYYNADITFKVKGEAMPFPFVFTKPGDETAVRRGKDAAVTWTGGRPEQRVKLELVQDGTTVSNLGEVANTGDYLWAIPKTLEKGMYSLRLTADKEVVDSAPFKVKAKSSAAVKIIPALLVVGGAVYFLLLKDDKNNSLPEPLDPVGG